MQIAVPESLCRAAPRAKFCVLGVVTLVLFALPVRAQQLVVTDVTYTATKDNTSDSHYRVAPLAGTATNWRAPVDYASGTAFVRLEVITKPSTQKTLYNVCFEGNQSACMGYPPAYTAPGTYDFSFAFSTFWQYTAVDWTKGVKNIALILKDESGNKVQGDAKFYPTTIHVVITLVAPGGKYVPPMPTDAGKPDAGMAVDSGKPADAGTPPDADAGEPPAELPKPPVVDAGSGQMDSGGGVLPATSGSNAQPAAGSSSVRRDAGVITLHASDAEVTPSEHSTSDGCSITGRPGDRAPSYGWLVLCAPLVRRIARRSERRRWR